MLFRSLSLCLSVMGGKWMDGRGWVRLCKANLDVRASTFSPVLLLCTVWALSVLLLTLVITLTRKRQGTINNAVYNLLKFWSTGLYEYLEVGIVCDAVLLQCRGREGMGIGIGSNRGV